MYSEKSHSVAAFRNFLPHQMCFLLFLKVTLYFLAIRSCNFLFEISSVYQLTLLKLSLKMLSFYKVLEIDKAGPIQVLIQVSISTFSFNVGIVAVRVADWLEGSSVVLKIDGS